jgi:hypothetical protein
VLGNPLNDVVDAAEYAMYQMSGQGHINTTRSRDFVTSHILVLQPVPDQGYTVQGRAIRNAVNAVARRA